MMRDNKKIKNDIDSFILSKDKHCLVTGTDVNCKHLEILKYLNSLNKKLRVLIRINAMSNCESLLKSNNFKTGTPRKVDNLILYVDSMQINSQRHTPQKFNCIIVYPIDSLKGMEDKNIQDILACREAEKVFWTSWQDNKEFNYLKEICDINHNITINHKDEEIHNRIMENNQILDNQEFIRLKVNDLNYSTIEDAISKEYSLGIIDSSSLGSCMKEGELGEFTLTSNQKSSKFIIKAKKYDEQEFILLVKKYKTK